MLSPTLRLSTGGASYAKRGRGQRWYPSLLRWLVASVGGTGRGSAGRRRRGIRPHAPVITVMVMMVMVVVVVVMVVVWVVMGDGGWRGPGKVVSSSLHYSLPFHPLVLPSFLSSLICNNKIS